MSEVAEEETSGGGAAIFAFAARKPKPNHTTLPTSFNRSELTRILDVYGRKVAAGEWRDYAIDQMKDRAVFSVFRRTSEVPLYQIVKQPKLARKQGAYAIVNATGYTLKRGHDLVHVLKTLDKPLKLVAG